MAGNLSKKILSFIPGIGKGQEDLEPTLEERQRDYDKFINKAHHVELEGHKEGGDYVRALQLESKAAAINYRGLRSQYDQLEDLIQKSLTVFPRNNAYYENDVEKKGVAAKLDYFLVRFKRVKDERDSLIKIRADLKHEIADLKHEIEDLNQRLGIERKDHERQMTEKEAVHEGVIASLKNDHTNVQQGLNLKNKVLQDRFFGSAADGFQPKGDKELDGDIGKIKLGFKTLGEQLGLNIERIKLLDEHDFLRACSNKESRLVFEKVVWRIIWDGFFSTPFRVFGNDGEISFQRWCELFPERLNDGSCVQSWPKPSAQSEKWRYVNVESLKQSTQVRKSFSQNFDETVKRLESTLETVYPGVAEEHRKKIKEYARSAADLAIDCGLQRARILPVFIDEGASVNRVDKNEWRDRNGRHSLENNEGIVRLFISPGLRRQGDGRGGCLDSICLYISPAEVFLA